MTHLRNRIEHWFEKLARRLYRNPIKTILLTLAFVAALVSQLPKLSIDISTEGFLHVDDPTLIDYNAFRDQFGRDEMIILAIQSPDIFTGDFLLRLKQLHEEMEEKVPHVKEITSLINARHTRGEADALIVGDLLEAWPETDAELGIIRQRVFDNPIYRNLMISEDGNVTTLMIQTQTYTSEGVASDVLEGFDNAPDAVSSAPDNVLKKDYLTDRENSEAVSAARTIAKKYAAADFQIHIAGSAAVTHFLKQSLMGDMKKFVILAIITVAVLLLIMFRRISGVLLPLFIVILSLVSTVGLMALFRVPIKLPTQILPSFILAVSVGYAVHILAIFFYRLRQTDSRENAVIYAVGHSGLAVLMTAATTAGGLFSFSASEIAPIADLGRFAGTGVFLAMIYTLLLIPAFLAIIPIKAKTASATHQSKTDRLLEAIGRLATKNPYKILILAAIIIAGGIIGATQIRFSHDPLRWFPEDNSIRVGTEKIDNDMRGSISLEVVIDTGKENGLYDPEFMQRLEESARYLEDLEVDGIFAGKAWSLTTLLKETHRALNENRKAFYKVPSNRRLIAQELLLFENSGSDDMADFTDNLFSKARLMIKVPFKDAIAYTGFLKKMNAHLKQTYPEAKITVTGMTTLLFRTLRNAMTSMKSSYIYALIIISILMVLLIGNFRIGLLSMIPNLTPIIITIGLMGWLDIPMNLFNMLIGNIAIGLAVDDTIHFMHNFRRYFDEKQDARAAVMETLQTTGRAMLVTTCVLSIGFFIFMFATMNNLFHFGLLTGVTILLALLADYFIAPALMVVVINRKKID